MSCIMVVSHSALCFLAACRACFVAGRHDPALAIACLSWVWHAVWLDQDLPPNTRVLASDRPSEFQPREFESLPITASRRLLPAVNVPATMTSVGQRPAAQRDNEHDDMYLSAQ